MTPNTAPISPHGSRQRPFPYMSASTYFPLQHRCWLKSSLRPARCSGSLTVFRAWNQTHAVTIHWTLSPSAQHFLTRRAWIYSPWPRPPIGSLSGPGLTQAWPCKLPPPPLQEPWGSRAWNCLPLVWSSSSSWQFLSSLESWSPCLRLKVRVSLRPLGQNCRIKMGRRRLKRSRIGIKWNVIDSFNQNLPVQAQILPEIALPQTRKDIQKSG